ncbi:MAG: hypothetical protein ACE367_00315 [Acidimicrobiales bacterium]
MNGRDGDGLLLWQRQVDPDAGRRRWRKLGVWFAAPAVAVTAITRLAGSGAIAVGLAICFALLGGVAALWVSVLGQAEVLNPEIRLAGGRLRDGTTSVVVADIEAWTTRRSGQFSVANGLRFPAPIALAEFRVTPHRPADDCVGEADGPGAPGPTIVTFPWPEMAADELEGVRSALEPHIPAPWVPPENLGS